MYKKRGIGKYRQWFRDAVDYWHDWQKEAREDYEFVEGKQWSKADLKKFAETARAPLVINRIKPLINLLSGYQKIHRYDVNFLGRTPDDVELAEVRTDVTKYICDRCGYDNEESAAFVDMAIGSAIKLMKKQTKARHLYSVKIHSAYMLTPKATKQISVTQNIFFVRSGLTKKN